MNNRLVILTLNWNGSDKIDKLKNSLLPNLENIEYQWFIRDNASIDDSCEKINNWNDKNIHLIKFTHNRDTFSQGMNFLFKEAGVKDNDEILLLNNDIIFNDKTSIKNMLKCLTPDVGAVGAKLLYTDTNKLQHAGVVFEPKFSLPVHFRSHQIDDINSSKNRYFQAVTGAVLLTKGKYYKNICTSNKSGINGLCEEYRWAFEDIDACLSIRYLQQMKIVYCGNTNIFHEESASLKKNPVNKLFMAHNVNLFRNRWSGKYTIDKMSYETDINYKLIER